MQKLEPIFSRQEQAVVYLFSRYWERIPEFKGKKILRIHTHFPDFAIVNVDGKEEAIEFEYGLNAFRSHLRQRRGKCLRDLNRDGVRFLYIVYWDENDDENELHRKIKKAGFKGKVKFVCLKEYFGAFVGRIPEKDTWHAAWEFSKKSTKTAYLATSIDDATNELERRKAVARREVCPGLYRTIGFNKSGSDFIEPDHWRSIHFFTTTTRFQADSIPSKLFVRSSGCKYFDGYFEIKRAFKIINSVNSGRAIEKYFKDFYFYNYEEFEVQYYDNSTCFVYSNFKLLTREKGMKLFADLDKKYTLGVRGSIIIRQKDNADIDRVVRK